MYVTAMKKPTWLKAMCGQSTEQEQNLADSQMGPTRDALNEEVLMR